jgi:hypothetical protein
VEGNSIAISDAGVVIRLSEASISAGAAFIILRSTVTMILENTNAVVSTDDGMTGLSC